MATIVTRQGKGTPLTNAELDANFTNLNTELGQKLVASDLSPYLLSATAAATYQTISGMSSYLTTASASSTYLTQSSAASTYQTQSGMSSYLTTSSAASTYLPLAGGTLSGKLTSSGVNGESLLLTTTGVASQYLRINNGGGNLYLGRDDSTGSFFGVGGYSSVLFSSGTAPVVIFQNAAERARFDSSGLTLASNLNFSGSNARITGDFTSTNRLLVQTTSANSNTVFGLIPSGTAVNSQFHVWGGTDINNAPLGAFTINANNVQIQSTASGTGTILPFRVLVGSNEVFRATTNSNVVIGTSTDDGSNKLQVTGNTALTGALSVSGSTTFSGGTANGVAYLNGSKVLTTGSALTFDGSLLKTSGALSVQGVAFPASGSGAELFWDGSESVLQSYNRTSSAYVPLWLESSYTRFGISGSEQMRLTGTGLGIGTSSPGTKLQVYNNINGTPVSWGNATRTGYLYQDQNGVGITNASGTVFDEGVYLDTANSRVVLYTNSTDRATLDSSGNLGIGTSSPTGKLSLNLGSATGTGGATSFPAWDSTYAVFGGTTTTSAAVGIGFNTTNGGVLTAIAPNVAWQNMNYLALSHRFYISASEAMRLDASGNLGLGVTPSAWTTANSMRVLDVSSTGAVGSDGGATFMTRNGYYNGSNWIYKTSSYANHFAANSSGQFAWYTAPSGTAGSAISFGDPKMTLTSAGILLLGTTSSPAASGALISAVGSGDTSIQITKSGVVATRLKAVSTGLAFGVDLADGDTERARIDSSGNFMVGTTSTLLSGKLSSIAGSAQNGAAFQTTAAANNYTAVALARNGNDGNVAEMWWNTSTQVGTIKVTSTATTYNTSSDYRLKNITGPITNSGAYIDSLRPVEGTWKADGSTFVGLIAHEVQEVSRTNIATGTKDGEQMQAMDYSASEIIANLIAEIQSLRARVAQLEAKG